MKEQRMGNKKIKAIILLCNGGVGYELDYSGEKKK